MGGAAHGCDTIDAAASDRRSYISQASTGTPHGGWHSSNDTAPSSYKKSWNLAPDPVALDHVAVDHHLTVLGQLQDAERAKSTASRKLGEADKATKISSRLVDQLSQEADRLRTNLAECEQALQSCRVECASLARSRELAELERDQLMVDLTRAREDNAAAKRGTDGFSKQVALLAAERNELARQLAHSTGEEARLRVTCAQL